MNRYSYYIQVVKKEGNVLHSHVDKTIVGTAAKCKYKEGATSWTNLHEVAPSLAFFLFRIPLDDFKKELLCIKFDLGDNTCKVCFD